MGCLSNLVGLSATCSQVDGRVYVGQLGMTAKELGNYLSGDYASEGDFLADRIAQAELQLQYDVIARYRELGWLRPWTFLDRGRIGEPDERQENMTAVASTRNGIVLDVCAPESNVLLQLSQISIWGPGGDVTLQVHDLTDGVQLTTITLTGTVAGQISTQEVDVTFAIKRRHTRLLISHDLPTFYRVNAHGGGCVTCNGGYFKQGIVSAYGARIGTGDAKKYSNIERQTHTAGLSVIASVTCDHNQILCEHKSLMAQPMAYKVCELACEYGLSNMDRFNNNTEDRDRLAARARSYGLKYADAMNTLYRGMPMPTDRICFVCNQTVRVAHVIP